MSGRVSCAMKYVSFLIETLAIVILLVTFIAKNGDISASGKRLGLDQSLLNNKTQTYRFFA